MPQIEVSDLSGQGPYKRLVSKQAPHANGTRPGAGPPARPAQAQKPVIGGSQVGSADLYRALGLGAVPAVMFVARGGGGGSGGLTMATQATQAKQFRMVAPTPAQSGLYSPGAYTPGPVSAPPPPPILRSTPDQKFSMPNVTTPNGSVPYWLSPGATVTRSSSSTGGAEPAGPTRPTGYGAPDTVGGSIDRRNTPGSPTQSRPDAGTVTDPGTTTRPPTTPTTTRDGGEVITPFPTGLRPPPETPTRGPPGDDPRDEPVIDPPPIQKDPGGGSPPPSAPPSAPPGGGDPGPGPGPDRDPGPDPDPLPDPDPGPDPGPLPPPPLPPDAPDVPWWNFWSPQPEAPPPAPSEPGAPSGDSPYYWIEDDELFGAQGKDTGKTLDEGQAVEATATGKLDFEGDEFKRADAAGGAGGAGGAGVGGAGSAGGAGGVASAIKAGASSTTGKVVMGLLGAGALVLFAVFKDKDDDESVSNPRKPKTGRCGCGGKRGKFGPRHKAPGGLIRRGSDWQCPKCYGWFVK